MGRRKLRRRRKGKRPLQGERQIQETQFLRGVHRELERVDDEACILVGEALAQGMSIMIFDLPMGTLHVLSFGGEAWVN